MSLLACPPCPTPCAARAWRAARLLQPSRTHLPRYIIGTDPYRPDSQTFVSLACPPIQLYRANLSSEPALFTPGGRAALFGALHTLLDPQNHPVLVHDDTGKSATSLVVALVRRLQGWSLTGIYAEGDLFAGESGGGEGSGVGEAGREVSAGWGKGGESLGGADGAQFIALFDPKEVVWPGGNKPAWAA